jgi:hypothetical protein
MLVCDQRLDHCVVGVALAFPFHEYMKDGFNKAILRRAGGGALATEVGNLDRCLRRRRH